MVRRAAEGIGIEVEVSSVPNPRVELEEHYYNAKHTLLLDLGLEPHLLDDKVIVGMLRTIARYRDRIVEKTVPPRTLWRPAIAELV